MTETTTRPKRRIRHATVVSAERLTPRMVRVVVGGDDLEGFDVGAFTDHYVKLQIPPPGVPVHALVELEDDADRQELTSPADLHVTWLRAGGGDAVLLDAVRALAFPEGPVQAFVHGEASAVRAVRRHLLAEREIPREALSASGYWKRARTDEEWREDKAEWNRLVEQDVA